MPEKAFGFSATLVGEELSVLSDMRSGRFVFCLADANRTFSPHLGIAYLRGALAQRGIETSFVDMSNELHLPPKLARLFSALTSDWPSVYYPVEFSLHAFLNDRYSKEYFRRQSHLAVLRSLVEELARRCDSLANLLVGPQTRFLCFSIYSSSLLLSCLLARATRRIAGGAITIVFGGPLLGSRPIRDILQFLGVADVLMIGEADHAITTLGPAHGRSGGDGVVKLKEGPVPTYVEQTPYDSLDELPIPCFDNIDWYAYSSQLTQSICGIDRSREIPVSSSRGCPYTCAFCGERNSPGKYRRRSPVAVAREMLVLQERFEPTVFRLNDAVLNASDRWLGRFCDSLIQNEISTPWYGNVRITKSIAKMAELLAKSGCAFLRCGIESGCRTVLSKARKNICVEDVSPTLQALSHAGVRVQGNFMYGLPGEGLLSFLKTLRLILQCRRWMDQLRYVGLTIAPGADMVENAWKYGLRVQNFSPRFGAEELNAALACLPKGFRHPPLFYVKGAIASLLVAVRSEWRRTART